jgi:hypothetical protein
MSDEHTHADDDSDFISNEQVRHIMMDRIRLDTSRPVRQPYASVLSEVSRIVPRRNRVQLKEFRHIRFSLSPWAKLEGAATPMPILCPPAGPR